MQNSYSNHAVERCLAVTNGRSLTVREGYTLDAVGSAVESFDSTD